MRFGTLCSYRFNSALVPLVPGLILHSGRALGLLFLLAFCFFSTLGRWKWSAHLLGSPPVAHLFMALVVPGPLGLPVLIFATGLFWLQPRSKSHVSACLAISEVSLYRIAVTTE